MPQLIIKIVDRGTNHTNQKTGETKPSQTGHMWFELIDYNGNITSHGFAPAPGYEGKPFAPGRKYDNDNTSYNFDQSKGDYQRSFEINNDQFKTLQRFTADPDAPEFGFNMYYKGPENSCIDFTYKALDIIDFVPNGYDGDLWPTWNIDNIKAIPSQNSYDNQLFISNDGGLFILDDTNQVTVRLFGNLVEDNQSPISTQLSSLLSTATKLNSNINNGKIKIEDASGDDISYSTSKGNNQNITQDKNLLPKDSKLIDKNGNEVTEEAAISITKDKNGEDVTITKSDIEVKAPDGTTTPLTSIINMKNSMINAISEFVSGGYKDIIKGNLGSDPNFPIILRNNSVRPQFSQNYY